MRPPPRQVLGAVAAALFLACQPDGVGSFTGTPTTLAPMSTSDAVSSSTSTSGSSTSTSATSTSTSATSTTGTVSTSTGDAASSTVSGPIFDMGVKDIGDAQPDGCKGKIDFLFVISREPVMKYNQEKLIAAFPKFIETIEAKFAEFDFHIMVVDGDDDWGHAYCTLDCPVIDCKIGDACCPGGSCPLCDPPMNNGDPCCPVPDYPCELLNQVTECEWTIGAGNIFAAGQNAPNKPCKMPDPERRYLVSGAPGLVDSFSCMAQVGTSGYGLLGEAMTRALYPEINAPDGCNAGFLRKDALLMVTFIGGLDYDSKGDPASWAGTVLGVKGDPGAVVFLEILDPDCPSINDRICEFIKMFPYQLIGDSDAASYAPIFDAATDLVATACAEYIPQ